MQDGSKSYLVEDVKAKLELDPELVELKMLVQENKIEVFSERGYGLLRYQGPLCDTNIDGLMELILSDAHGSLYSIHPGSTKMYCDLKEVYWWNGLKRNIAKYVLECLNYQ